MSDCSNVPVAERPRPSNITTYPPATAQTSSSHPIPHCIVFAPSSVVYASGHGAKRKKLLPWRIQAERNRELDKLERVQRCYGSWRTLVQQVLRS